MAMFGFTATIASRMSWKARWERNSLEPPTKITRGGIFSAIWESAAVSGFGIDNEISNFEFRISNEKFKNTTLPFSIFHLKLEILHFKKEGAPARSHPNQRAKKNYESSPFSCST